MKLRLSHSFYRKNVILVSDISLTKDEESWLAGAKTICVIHERTCRKRGWSLKGTPQEFMT